MKIIQMFKDGLPTGEIGEHFARAHSFSVSGGRQLSVRAIEKASIDEAFIDFTRPVREAILARFPHLAQVPPDAPDGADTPLPPPPPRISWEGLGTVIPIKPPPPPPPEDADADAQPGEDAEAPDAVNAEEDANGEDPEEKTTWHDGALSIAAELMGRIRADIHAKLGYTTSAVRLPSSPLFPVRRRRRADPLARA